MEAFMDQAKDILNDRGEGMLLDRQLAHLAEEFDKTDRRVMVKVWIYKPLAFVVLLFVPLVSATVSVLSTQHKGTEAVAIGLSYGLTILTLLNSIFRPADRFRELCTMGMRVHTLRDEFMSKLREHSKGADKQVKLIKLCEEYEQKLNPTNTRLIALFLPYAPDQKPYPTSEEPEKGNQGQETPAPQPVPPNSAATAPGAVPVAPDQDTPEAPK